MQITGNTQPFSIRPEHIRFLIINGDDVSNTGNVTAKGKIEDVQYLGAVSKIQLTIGSQIIALIVSSSEYAEADLPKIGEFKTVCWPKKTMVML